MNELLDVARLHLMLLESGVLTALPADASATERLDHLGGHLLRLARSVCQELPDPARYLRRTAAATLELAMLAFLGSPDALEALDALTLIQRRRLPDSPDELETWRNQPAEEHLRRAFWCLARVAAESAPTPPREGLLLEHAADAANHLAAAALTSGAWDLVGGEPPLGPQGSEPTDSPVRESPRAEPLKGDAV